MSSFENKIVVITGCASGIGLATTLLFLSRKALVFGVDISPFTASLPPAHSPNFTFHQANLGAPSAVDDAIAACKARHGPRIDVLANVAGVMDHFCSVDTVKDAEWERVLTINLTVPVRMMAAVLPGMREQKSGAIVNVGSYSSLSGAVAGVAYTASKHGLAGATKNVVWRFRNEGIRCNAVLPGGKNWENISRVNVCSPNIRRSDEHRLFHDQRGLGPRSVRYVFVCFHTSIVVVISLTMRL